MNINDSIAQNILNIIQNDILNKSIPLNILTIFHTTELTFSKIKDQYPNSTISYIKITDSYTENIDIEDNSYDYIILVDILEKLVNPNIFLNNINLYLKNGGTLLCQATNLMYRNVIKDLLAGKFTYTDSGALDKNNLRFFTLNEISQLLDRSGYDVQQALAQVLNPSTEEESFVNSLCTLVGESFKLNYNSYSYVVRATPKVTKTLFDYVLD